MFSPAAWGQAARKPAERTRVVLVKPAPRPRMQRGQRAQERMELGGGMNNKVLSACCHLPPSQAQPLSEQRLGVRTPRSSAEFNCHTRVLPIPAIRPLGATRGWVSPCHSLSPRAPGKQEELPITGSPGPRPSPVRDVLDVCKHVINGKYTLNCLWL